MDNQETDAIDVDVHQFIALVTVRHTSSLLTFALPNEELYRSK